MKPLEVRVVIYEEAGVWVAQGVDYDIAAHATELIDLPAAFERTVAQNLCVNMELGREGFNGIPAPPAVFREMYEAPRHIDMQSPDSRSGSNSKRPTFRPHLRLVPNSAAA